MYESYDIMYDVINKLLKKYGAATILGNST